VSVWNPDAHRNQPTFEAIRALTERAQVAREAGDHRLAAARFDSLAACNPADGRILDDLATELGAVGDHRGAVAALIAARDLGAIPRAVAEMEIARCWARAAQRDSCLAWIGRSLADGYEQRSGLIDEPDFSSMTGDPAFRRLAGRPNGERPSRTEAWRSDLDFLVAEMKRLHFVYSKAELPAALQSEIRSLRTDIPDLTDQQVFARMEQLMAGLGDGHSVLYPVSDDGPLWRLPLSTYFFADGLYVIGAPAEYEAHIGDRIEAIGGVEIPTLLDRLADYVPRDNSMGVLWTGPLMLSFPALLNAMGAAPNPDAVSVTLVNTAGVRETIVLKPAAPGGSMHVPKLGPAPGADIPRWLSRVPENYWFEEIADLSTTYVQFNQVIDMESESMRDFALRLRRHITETKPKNLVVDLRHNNGGNSDRLIPFIRTMVHFETTTPGGRLWVLVGRNTFSAAQVLANNLDRLTNALFVGEPTGSRPNFVGEDTGLRLPWSGYYGSISSRFHQTWNQDDRIWIAPDYPVALTAVDYFAGRDPVMDRLEEFIRATR
jgi:hypothetical protein